MWWIVFIIAAVAFGLGLAHIWGEELRRFRSKRAFDRVNDFQSFRKPAGGDYRHFDQEQMLRNRSERWDS